MRSGSTSTVPPKRISADAGPEADFGEEIERRTSDAKLIIDTAEKYGIPVEILWKPVRTMSEAPGRSA